MRQFSFHRMLPLVVVSLVLVAPALASEKVPITTQSPEALKAYLAARDLSERLQGAESLRYYDEAIAKDPRFAMAYLNASLVQPTAEAFFQKLNQAVAAAEHVSEGERLWISGFEAGVNGKPQEQRRYYRRLVEMYPRDERAHNLLGTHYFGQQEWDLAIEQYELATQINPEFSPPYNQLGYAYRALKNYKKAERAFKKYIELIPNDPNPYDSYAELLLKTGKLDESIKNYEKALTHNPNFVASHLGIATNLCLKGNHDAALERLDRLYAMARNDGERRTASFGKTVVYVDAGETQAALKEVDRQFELAKKNQDASAMAGDLNLMGNILYEGGYYDEAEAKYEKSLQTLLDSDRSADIKRNAKRTNLYNRARVALGKKELAAAKSKAKDFHEQASQAQNTFQIWLAHDLLGMIALEESHYDRAVEHLRQANQQNPYVLYRLALAYQGQGNSGESRSICDEAAHFNVPTSLNFAFARAKAMHMLSTASR